MAEKPIDICIVQTQRFDDTDYVDYRAFLEALSERDRQWKEKLDDAEKRICELSEKCAYLKEQLEKEWNKTERPECAKADVDFEAVIYEQQREIRELDAALDVIMNKYIMLKQNAG